MTAKTRSTKKAPAVSGNSPHNEQGNVAASSTPKKTKKEQGNDASTTPNKKTKMTAEEKQAARERARAAMGITTPVKKSKTPIKSNTPVSKKKAAKGNKETLNEIFASDSGAKESVQDMVADKLEEDTPLDSQKKESVPTPKKKKLVKKTTLVTEDDSQDVEDMDCDDDDTKSSVIPPAKKSDKKAPPKSVVAQLTGIAKLLVDLQESLIVENVNRDILELWDRIENDPKNVQEADLFGAALVLVQTMKKWQGYRHIQGNVCECLSTYASVSEKGKTAFMRCGGIEAIVNIMLQFLSDAEILSSGCNALAQLSVLPYQPNINRFHAPSLSGELPLRQAWVPFITNYQGIPVVIAKAMVSLDGQPEALADCACLLGNLIRMSNNSSGGGMNDVEEVVKSQIREAGIPTLMFNAVQKHYNNDRLRHEGGKLSKMFL